MKVPSVCRSGNERRVSWCLKELSRVETDSDRPVRLRPRRPKRTDDTPASGRPHYGECWRCCRIRVSRRRPPEQAKWPKRRARRQDFAQRCAVRVRYPRIASAVSGPPMRDTLPGRVRWGMTVTARGFNAKSDEVDIVETAAGWQSAVIPDVQVILSPEFGERLDLKH